jgi:hypothetical protein
MRYPGASVSAEIAAPIEALWEVVSDVLRHPQLAGSGEVQQTEILGGDGLALGGLFRSQQKMYGLNYVTVSRAVAWDPPYTFAWRVGFPFAPGVGQTWLFNLTPVAGGTRVENGVALLYALPPLWPFSLLYEDLGRREASVIPPTLENLARIVGAPVPTQFDIRHQPPAMALAHMPPAIIAGGLWLGAALVGARLLRKAR